MARGRRRTPVIELTFAEKVNSLTSICPLSDKALEIYQAPKEILESFSSNDLVNCSREVFTSVSEHSGFLDEMNQTLTHLEAQEHYSDGDDSLPW